MLIRDEWYHRYPLISRLESLILKLIRPLIKSDICILVQERKCIHMCERECIMSRVFPKTFSLSANGSCSDVLFLLFCWLLRNIGIEKKKKWNKIVSANFKYWSSGSSDITVKVLQRSITCKLRNTLRNTLSAEQLYVFFYFKIAAAPTLTIGWSPSVKCVSVRGLCIVLLCMTNVPRRNTRKHSIGHNWGPLSITALVQILTQWHVATDRRVK